MKRLGVTLLLAAAVLFCQGAKKVNPVHTLHSSVVRIETEEAFCTATAIGLETFLSASHCMNDKNPEKTTGTLITELGQEYPFDVIAGGDEIDLVLLHAKVPGVEIVPIADQTPEPGTPVTAIGWSKWFGVMTSQIIPTRIMGHTSHFNVTDKATRRGFSGGPLINEQGELVGVNVRINQEGTVGYAVPVEFIHEFLDAVAEAIK